MTGHPRAARAAERAARAARLAHARDEARALVRRLGLPLPIDVEDVAALLGAEVIDGPLQGAQAQLMRWGHRARIRVSRDVTHPGARRFSVAHELGHLWLDHAGTVDVERCAAASIEGMPPRLDEVEANAFAAELLLPAPLVGRWIEAPLPDLDVARALADAAGVSVTAAALRICELSPYPCAVVQSARGRITWAARSPSFPIYLPRGRVAGPAAGVTELLASGTLPREPRAVPTATWFGARDAADLTLFEHSAAIGGSDDVLSMLRIATPGNKIGDG